MYYFLKRVLMQKKICLFLLYVFTGVMLIAQEWDKTAYAREIIAELASENMHGRGYVNGGDQLAAAYIKKNFQQFGLNAFTNDYYQFFSFSVNTFPGLIRFTLTGKNRLTKDKMAWKAKPGIDLLVSAGFPHCNGRYNVVVFDSSYTVSDNIFEKFKSRISKASYILVDDRGIKDKKKQEYFSKVKQGVFKSQGIIELNSKLTHSVSITETTTGTIKLLTDSFRLDLTSMKRLKATIEVENEFIPEHKTQNVIGYVKGRLHPDSFIVFSAHYDHLGQLGKDVFFPGANDNASGCAMLLNLARYYAQPEHRPDYSLAFIAFAGEEIGLKGSTYYTQHPLFPLANTCFLINMDIMGTGDEGITVVNGTLFKKEFDALVNINANYHLLKEVKIRGKAANSDHYPFSEKGVKAFFIYTLGGIRAYHDVYDRAETLPLTKFEELFELITRFTDFLQHR
jgi:aminopeptidase YwaD